MFFVCGNSACLHKCNNDRALTPPVGHLRTLWFLPRWTWRSEAEVRSRCLPEWRGVPYVLCWRLQSWGRYLSTCRWRVVVLKIVVRENGSVKEALEDGPSGWYLIKSVELNSKSCTSPKPRKIKYVVAICVGDTMNDWKISFEAA